MNILEILRCPICSGVMQRIDKTIKCEKGHSFDIAKSGYVNMLPPGKESNAHTGDEREMVRARVNFLAKEYYSEISRTLASIISEYGNFSAEEITVCDMGCGEGSHTCRIAGELCRITERNVMVLGFDASKYAAECASKLSRARGYMPSLGIGCADSREVSAYFMPANIFRLPTVESSFDAAISMFAPIAGEEAARILKPHGILAVAASGRDHLIEMRNVIYNDVRLADFVPPTQSGFKPIATKNLRYRTEIESPEDIWNLFMMTPFYYKTNAEGRERLLALDHLTVTVDVNYFLFEVI